jgi:hypothetical protein
MILGEISGCHGSEYEDDCLLGCWTTQSGRSLPTFQRCFYQTTWCNIPEENDFYLKSLFQLQDHKEMNELENDYEW